MRCCRASSKSNERVAGTNGVVSVPLCNATVFGGPVIEGSSAATLTFFCFDLGGDESETALRFALLAAESPLADRVETILETGTCLGSGIQPQR